MMTKQGLKLLGIILIGIWLLWPAQPAAFAQGPEEARKVSTIFSAAGTPFTMISANGAYKDIPGVQAGQPIRITILTEHLESYFPNVPQTWRFSLLDPDQNRLATLLRGDTPYVIEVVAPKSGTYQMFLGQTYGNAATLTGVYEIGGTSGGSGGGAGKDASGQNDDDDDDDDSPDAPPPAPASNPPGLNYNDITTYLPYKLDPRLVNGVFNRNVLPDGITEYGYWTPLFGYTVLGWTWVAGDGSLQFVIPENGPLTAEELRLVVATSVWL